MAAEKDDIRIINEYQKNLYGNMEKTISERLFSKYNDVLQKHRGKDTLKILDIGGASGYFALKLKEYYCDTDCDVTVIDSTVFETWSEFSGRINCIETSVDDIDKIFSENTFDIIFANRVFHHFVRKNWKQTVEGIDEIIKKIHKILKKNGTICITEHFFDGLFVDGLSSRIVYALSSNKCKAIIALCKKIGVESAGVGVCFLSKKTWIKKLTDNKFEIEKIDESKKERLKEWYKKIMFLNKKNTLDNIIIAMAQKAGSAFNEVAGKRRRGGDFNGRSLNFVGYP